MKRYLILLIVAVGFALAASLTEAHPRRVYYYPYAAPTYYYPPVVVPYTTYYNAPYYPAPAPVYYPAPVYRYAYPTTVVTPRRVYYYGW